MNVSNNRKISSKIPAGIFTAAIIFPLGWLTIQSLAKNWRFPALVPPEMNFRAWNYLFDWSAGVFPALINSLAIAAVVTCTAIISAFPAARAIALHDFKGKNFFLFVLLLPILSPAIATAMGGHAFFLRLGLTDSYLGVILTHLIPTVPYCVLTLTGSFSRFDTNLELQAQTLGANSWQVFRFVTLPAMLPGIITSAVFAFLISWSQYLTTLLVGGGRIITLPLILIGFQRSSDETVTAALTLIFIAPTLVFLALTARLRREV